MEAMVIWRLILQHRGKSRNNVTVENVVCAIILQTVQIDFIPFWLTTKALLMCLSLKFRLWSMKDSPGLTAVIDCHFLSSQFLWQDFGVNLSFHKSAMFLQGIPTLRPHL